MALDFSPDRLLEVLRKWPPPRRLAALVSGGLDSTVLLQALASLRSRLPAPLVVLHFDHGIAGESRSWAEWVEREAEALGVPVFVETLCLEGCGAIETRARDARYARLAEWMRAEDCCLTAHQADDQAETFLLQALRGAGPAGLAGMATLGAFGGGWLGRPLLGWTRGELLRWAQAQSLHWIEDPGNRDPAAARNWLRHSVWPTLTAYWPQATRTLARSSALAAQGAALLADLAREDLARVACGNDRLSIGELLAVAPERRRNLLRHWLRETGLPLPSAAKLEELDRGWIERDPGVRAVLAWPGVEARRFRGMLHLFAPLPQPPAQAFPLAVGETIDFGVLGSVRLMSYPQGALRRRNGEELVSLRFRRGGERLRPAGSAHHRTLKNLLQERQILPWMRFRLPLLYVGEELAAVAGVAIAAEFAGEGWSLRWEHAPPLQ